MSILEKYSAAIKNKDEATMNELLHDDFKFTMHKSGNFSNFPSPDFSFAIASISFSIFPPFFCLKYIELNPIRKWKTFFL